ncbi:hypothetical protein AB0A74_11115 [Saccharothrix sp. NPDC042600]
MAELSELVGGYDFGTVVEAYWRGHDTRDRQRPLRTRRPAPGSSRSGRR